VNSSTFPLTFSKWALQYWWGQFLSHLCLLRHGFNNNLVFFKIFFLSCLISCWTFFEYVCLHYCVTSRLCFYLWQDKVKKVKVRKETSTAPAIYKFETKRKRWCLWIITLRKQSLSCGCQSAVISMKWTESVDLSFPSVTYAEEKKCWASCTL